MIPAVVRALTFVFGDAAATLAPWIWGGLGLLTGAVIAVAVIRSRHPHHQRRPWSAQRGFPRSSRD
ncbi:hypothetical protein [Salinactinospora qingdaonensis]|uniref:hypothetical protein n=1 Tax=Salinactinospora qingdaonensis TaxID=702744 RepID=UPI0031F168EA